MVGRFYVYKNKLATHAASQKNGSYFALTDADIGGFKTHGLEQKCLA